MEQNKDLCFHFRIIESQHDFALDEEMMEDLVFEDREEAYAFQKQQKGEYEDKGYTVSTEYNFGGRKVVYLRKGTAMVEISVTIYRFKRRDLASTEGD